MGKRIVVQDEIDYQISSLKSLSGNEGYKGTQNSLKTTLNNINSSLGKELRGNYVKIINSINSDFEILCDRADATQVLLQNCRNSFVNLDQELRQEVNSGKLDGALTEGGNVCYTLPGGESNSSQRIIPGNDTQAQLMEEMLNSNTPINAYSLDTMIRYTNSEGKSIGYYQQSNGCTWYAAARFRQVNGYDLQFSKAGGNASNWPNSIDRNTFDVNSTSDASCIKINTIAVSNEYDKGARASSNHVAYVEAVKDGYVYYTDGSYGSSPSTWGYVQKVSVEEFQRQYEYIISAK